MIPSREIRTVPNADGTECAKRRAIGLEIVGSTRNPLPGLKSRVLQNGRMPDVAGPCFRA